MTAETPDLIETRTADEIRGGTTIAAAQTLGRYTVLAKVGEGGMGQVYAAYDPKLDRRVALKVLHHLESKADAERLVREAKALARLSHPNVVTVHEVDELVESGGQPLIAMEFVEGRTLKHWVRHTDSPAQTTTERLELLVQAGKGLVAAHREGLIHRDFKPGNVLIGFDGRVRVADFGLAVADGSTRADLKVDGEASVESSLTRTGVLVGTPAYMAPEQFNGDAVDARCDQFSFCVTAWEVLFGVRPYAGGHIDGLRAAFRSGGMRRPQTVDVPSAVEAALRKGLSVRARSRFGTTAELVQLLETELNILKGKDAPRRKSRMWKYLLVASLLAAAAWGATKAWRRGLVAACEARAAKVGDIWNEDVGSGIFTALRSTPEGELIHDEDRLSHWLDKHATELQAATLELCRHQTVEQDWSPELLRKAEWCISERQFEFQNELEGFRTGDATAATFAIDRVLGLRPLDPCLDPRALQVLAVPPEEQRDELRNLKSRLNEASRLGVDSRDKQLATVRQLGEEALVLGWKPMVIKARREEGVLLSQLGNTEEAANAWEEAWFQAAESSEWQLATMLAREVAHVASTSNKDMTKARFWLSLGRVSHEQSYDPSGSLDLSLLESDVLLESEAGNTDKAELLSRQLVRRAEELYGPDHYKTADALELLAATLHLKSKYEESERLRERAIKIQLALFGRNRKKLANDLLNISLTQRYLGKSAEAKENTEAAYEIMWAIAPDDPQVAVMLMGLAVSTIEAGDTATGVLRGEEALELARASHSPGNTYIIDVLATVGDMLRLDGREVDALDLYRESGAMARAALGPDHWQTIYPQIRICLGLAGPGEKSAAEEECRKLESALSEVKEVGPREAQGFSQLSMGFAQLGLAEDALSWSRKGVEASRRILGDSSNTTIASKMILARALALSGEHEEARRTASRALAAARALEKRVAGDDLGSILGLYANAYAAMGDNEKALEGFREGIERSRYKGHIKRYRASIQALCSQLGYQPACE